jgi:hypothetical protein
MTPIPVGTDRLVSLGNRFALPLIGNFSSSLSPRNDTTPGNGTNNPFFNERSPFDVNDDGFISPLDALLVINLLDAAAAQRADTASPSNGASRIYWDTNNDTHLSPLDAILVINAMEAETTSAATSAPRASLSLSVSHASVRAHQIDAAMRHYDTIARRRDAFPWEDQA